MEVKLSQDVGVRFFVRLQQSVVEKKFSEPELVSFKLQGTVLNEGVLARPKSDTIDYQFFIGNDLGDTWIGFDPGTTGSCIAAASSLTGVVMETDGSGKEIISPSLIAFDSSMKPEKELVRGDIASFEGKYKYGNEASKVFLLSTTIGFQSIKKLLGYRDELEIRFANNHLVKVDGRFLSTLLVKGLFHDFKEFVEKHKAKHSPLLKNGIFRPRRAVVAVPNNYTAPKIIDMLSCLRSLDNFTEIRYITEAEAVLCYYVHQHDRLHPINKDGLDDETVLVFDMGGATINTIIADVYQRDGEEGRYNIDIDSKIGYGIGGDTIDYCLLKTIFKYEHELGDLKKFNPFLPENEKVLNKRQIFKKIKEAIFKLKREIIFNYYQNVSQSRNPFMPPGTVIREGPLLKRTDIERAVYEICDLAVSLSKDAAIMKEFSPNDQGHFPIFENEFFSELVYRPIQEAVLDVLDLSNGNGGYIDTVIYSGRSCLFPLVKETVEGVLSKVKNKKKDATTTYIQPTIIGFTEEELKTVVVKGAAWYGAHSSVVKLSPQRVNATYGVCEKKAALQKNIKFYPLINMGEKYTVNQGVAIARGGHSIHSDFAHDGGFVTFFQVMGKDAEKIVREDQKHKFSRQASIKNALSVKWVGIELNISGKLTCKVKNVAEEIEEKVATAKEFEIKKENNEHYTWMIQ